MVRLKVIQILTNTRAFFERKKKDKSKHYYLAIKRRDKDYLSVIEEAKKVLFTLIDLLHLGYPDMPFGFHKSCLVIGSIKPHLARLQPVYYFVDGAYKSDSNLYSSLVEKIKRLSENQKIQKESLQKIISAFRHLRLARDADELEQKFINYWIGLEYIFSNYDADENTIARLKLYFVHAHSIVYIKRNLFEYYQDIQRLKLLDRIPTYKSDNLDFLLLEETYDFIIENYSLAFPLLAFRAKKYKRLLTDKKNLIDIINRHRSNLEWHLVRCYRIRNEIIHDAAIHLNIEMITNNLRYYLTFILNALIDYLDATPDVNLDGNLSINDYFLLQEIRFRSLAIEEFNINLLMNEKSVTEVFSN